MSTGIGAFDIATSPIRMLTAIAVMVVAQLVERPLPTPEVGGLNPVIGKIYMYCQLYWKDENKEKRGQEWPNFLKPP